MDYTAKAIEALGKALADKDFEIQMLRMQIDTLSTKVKELQSPTDNTEKIGRAHV